MAAMTRLLNQRTVAGWFRFVALLEAVSWVGLLIGMYFKYLGTPRTEIGVKVFGPAHGAVFVAFVALGLLAAVMFKWATGTWLLGIVASIVPLASVVFLMWVERTGRLGAESVVAPIAQPGQPVGETT
ncbi:integral membrane protein [Mycolicibacterium flavescens]|uniref:DUF3817 domain-containing protein n=1 Tax=Mycobacterium TaxID=1763 RepID=UPI000A4CEC74|nr:MULTISPECIES: DUF3817 domain-containing protein [Mycobacterium]VEG39473.1 integral membrane protein [Mycolicibacterium flavescens]